MRVLVTGATGFIGGYVVEELLDRGSEVVATARSEQKAMTFPWYGAVEFIPFAIGDCCDRFFNSVGDIDTVIHLAWAGLPNYKSYSHIEENLASHCDFLRQLAVFGVKKIVVAGTCLEYGMQNGCLSEEMRPQPTNPYAEAKNELRKYLEKLQEDYPYILSWIRLFYMYGEGQHPGSLLAQLDKAIDNHCLLFNMSGGEQLRDYLPVEQVAVYIAELMEKDNAGGIINCCSGRPVSIKSLVQQRIRERNAEIELNLGFYPYPDYEPMEFWGDNSRMKNIIG